MPLPNYSPRSDSFGNWYFGGFQMDNQVEVGYGAATELTPTQSEWNTFLDAALGSTNWAVSGTNYYYRFPVPYEPQTGQVTTTNYRFSFPSTSIQLNTKLSGSATVISASVSAFSTFFSNVMFAVANQSGMWIGLGVRGTYGTLTVNVQMLYIGWLNNPVFPLNTNDRIRNAILVDNDARAAIISPIAEGSTVSNTCYPSSARTCQVSTPGANVTDISVINTNALNLCLGTIPNSVIYHGSSGLTRGQLYRIPPSQDPDGNTEQNIWLCEGGFGLATGWNGSSTVSNAGYRLVRVWSNNIT